MPIEAVEHYQATCDRCTFAVAGGPSESWTAEESRVVADGGRVIYAADLGLVLCRGCYLGLVIALERDDSGLLPDECLRLELPERVAAWLEAWSKQEEERDNAAWLAALPPLKNIRIEDRDGRAYYRAVCDACRTDWAFGADETPEEGYVIGEFADCTVCTDCAAEYLSSLDPLDRPLVEHELDREVPIASYVDALRDWCVTHLKEHSA